MLLVFQKFNYQKIMREYLLSGVKQIIIENPLRVVSYHGVPFTTKNFIRGMRVEYGKHKLFNKEMIDGIEYTIQVSNPLGSRIIEMKYNGEPVTEDQEFNLVINNYRASGSGGFDMIRNAPTVKTDLTNIVELLAKYIMDHQTIDFTPIHNINIIK